MSQLKDTATGVRATSQTTSLIVSAVLGNQLVVRFSSLPNNMPAHYGNRLLAWRNQNTIPYDSQNAAAVVPIRGNSPNGSIVFQDMIVDVGNSYLVGYAVGGDLGARGQQKWGNICSSVFVPAAGQSGIQAVPSLTLESYGPSYVSLAFKLPDGCLPKSNGAWVGIWDAEQASYTRPARAAAAITFDSASGSVAINTENLIHRGRTYTVALFMSGWGEKPSGQTPMACTISFTV